MLAQYMLLHCTAVLTVTAHALLYLCTMMNVGMAKLQSISHQHLQHQH